MTRRTNSRIPGVYSIHCLDNGRIYVGQSGDFSSRWGQHLDALNRKTHHNLDLQSDWTRLGPSRFSFTVLEVLDNELSRLAREKHHIQVNLSRCYNVEWDRSHTIVDGVIINKLTRKPLIVADSPPSPKFDPAPAEDLVSRWARMQRVNARLP
jgi:hypothetical protein